MGDPLRQQIAAIPGGEGWWHSTGEETFNAIADELAALKVPESTIASILERAYSAVANEYGA